MARDHTRTFLDVIGGEGFAEPNPRPMFPNPPGLLPIEPHSPGLRDRIWWGAGSRATAEWTAEQGMNLMSSTLLTEDTGVPFHELQAEQIQVFRDAWKAAGHERDPRVSVSRSIFPIVNDLDRQYFLRETASQDQVGHLDGGLARFGKTYAGEPDQLVRDLAEDDRDRRRGHAAAHRPEPARRRLQRPCHRERPDPPRPRRSAGADRIRRTASTGRCSPFVEDRPGSGAEDGRERELVGRLQLSTRTP